MPLRSIDESLSARTQNSGNFATSRFSQKEKRNPFPWWGALWVFFFLFALFNFMYLLGSKNSSAFLFDLQTNTTLTSPSTENPQETETLPTYEEIAQPRTELTQNATNNASEAPTQPSTFTLLSSSVVLQKSVATEAPTKTYEIKKQTPLKNTTLVVGTFSIIAALKINDELRALYPKNGVELINIPKKDLAKITLTKFSDTQQLTAIQKEIQSKYKLTPLIQTK